MATKKRRKKKVEPKAPATRKARQKHYRELRKIVKRSLSKYRDLFLLPRWPLFFQRVDHRIGNAEGDEFVAVINVDRNNVEVRVSYRNTLKLECAEQVIVHEIAHWVLDPLSEYLCTVLTKKELKNARRLWEEVVETIAKALVQPDDLTPSDVCYPDSEFEDAQK